MNTFFYFLSRAYWDMQSPFSADEMISLLGHAEPLQCRRNDKILHSEVGLIPVNLIPWYDLKRIVNRQVMPMVIL